MGVEGPLGREDDDDGRVVGRHDEIARAVLDDGSAGRVDECLDGAGGLGGVKQNLRFPDVDFLVEAQIKIQGDWRRCVEDRVWADPAEIGGDCLL